MSGMTYRLTCELGFRDGNVFPRFVRPGEVVEVDEATYLKMRQSDPRAFNYADAPRMVPKSNVAPIEKEAEDA